MRRMMMIIIVVVVVSVMASSSVFHVAFGTSFDIVSAFLDTLEAVFQSACSGLRKAAISQLSAVLVRCFWASPGIVASIFRVLSERIVAKTARSQRIVVVVDWFFNTIFA